MQLGCGKTLPELHTQTYTFTHTTTQVYKFTQQNFMRDTYICAYAHMYVCIPIHKVNALRVYIHITYLNDKLRLHRFPLHAVPTIINNIH